LHGPFWALLTPVASRHCCVDAVVEHTCPEKQFFSVSSHATFASTQKASV
jgi:hypothetical protein